MNFKDKLLEKLYTVNSKSFFNKYYLAIFAFVIWLSFFDRYSLITQYKLTQSVNELKEQKTDYEEQLKAALVERKTIEKDIEKYGRERYLFHRPDEEIILIK